MLPPEALSYAKSVLSSLKSPVKLLFFRGDTEECIYCDKIEEFLEDLSSVCEKLDYAVYPLGSEKAGELEVFSAPVILFQSRPNIRYLGLPSGHEFPAFLEVIKRVSYNEFPISYETAKKIASINEKVRIMVFVTPTCPYCPKAVLTAHAFAFYNPNIRSEMIEAYEYRRLADAYRVLAVPKVVIEGPERTVTFEGSWPEDAFAEKLLEAVR